MRVCDRCGACFDDDNDFCAVDGASLIAHFAGSRILAGRYRLERKLAAGAMGQVFEAVHLAVGSRVAVKVMQPTQKDVRVALQRFHKEARILGAVKHPNAVLITDFDVDNRASGSVAFLVTELLRGRSLADLLDEREALSLEDVERLVTPLCEAVDEAHALGIIHRDLKPSNVFLEHLRDGSEVVKVLDFGIAKLLARSGTEVPAPIRFDFDGTTLSDADQNLRDEILHALDDDGDVDHGGEDEHTHNHNHNHQGPADQTADGRNPRSPTGSREGSGAAAHEIPARTTLASTFAGLMVGTIPYMAPEQMTADRITRRSDVHALAVMVFEMLAGRLPFDGDDDDIISQKLSDERPSLRDRGLDVDPDLDALLMRCFAVDPEERPERCSAIAQALATAVGRRAGAEPDPVGALALRVTALSRALSRLASLAPTSESYALARDVLLSAGIGLPRIRGMVRTVRPLIAAPPQKDLVAAHLDLDDAIASIRAPLSAIAAATLDGGQHLILMWRRFDDANTLLASVFEDDERPADPLAVNWVAPNDVDDVDHTPFDVLVGQLLSRDALEAVDALAAVLDARIDETVRALAVVDAMSRRLFDGLWRHADAVLLRDLGAERGGLRFVPYLAGLTLDEGRFASVVNLLRDRRGMAVADDLSRPDSQTEDERGASPNVNDDRIRLRCLLLHPIADVRAVALTRLPLADLWTTIAHPRTPLTVQAQVFSQLKREASVDHLKVFFFCVREAISTSSPAELREAVFLVRGFFEIPAFHEDILFEPLLELDRHLRSKADDAGILDESYARAVSLFMGQESQEEVPLEHLRDVPLPLQRKLAREGHFLATFVCHANERVARETLPHLLRLDDVTRYLRMVTINRIVLVELAKRRRFFKKDSAKVALLGNPKTPVGMARAYVGLVPSEQLRLLSTNRGMNPDVRRLVLKAAQS